MLYTREDLAARRAHWKSEGKTVVFTNGCFDILHAGHIRLLESARSLGDVLIVALNTDASVSRIKGPNRPLISAAKRAGIISQLAAVDAVTLFDEDTPCALLEALLPDILVKGADWSHNVVGREIVEWAGGRIVVIPLEPGLSTTSTVEEILLRRGPQEAALP